MPHPTHAKNRRHSAPSAGESWPEGATKRLSDASVGERLAIVGVGGEPAVRLRLLEMGLIPGTEVRVVRRAPLGDPLEVEVRGCHLAVSGANAACLSCR